MKNEEETKKEKLARLQNELKDLEASLPEHCYSSEGYINVHRAKPEHMQKIEDIEDEIKKLKAEPSA